MVARHWRGWTKTLNADAYERLLKDTVFPQLAKIPGHHGAHILRCEREEETEFVVINYFESLDAVKAFAGPNYETPVFEPEAKRLLSRIEKVANHYNVAASPSFSGENQHAH
jgi:antibiotic biosynthesis monooxygenase (ABM) superfamily enzyme